MTSIEKALAIHDYITYNVDYDYANYLADTIPSSSYTAEGALIGGKAVCAGYAFAFSLLAETAGFEVTYVGGSADNGSGKGYACHAWNEIKIDGVWYNVDTTWDDPTYENKPASDHSNNCYDYFLVSDATLGKNHKPDYYVGRYPKDYSKADLCNAIAASSDNIISFSNDADLKANIKNIIAKGKTEFYVYSATPIDNAWDKYNQTIKRLLCFVSGRT